MHAPTQIAPTKLADYLEVMTRSTMEPGLSWKLVDSKWDGIREAFADFDPRIVAGYTPADVDRLMRDEHIIRNRKKIEAVIHNAGELINIEREYGSVKRYLESLGPYDAVAKDLHKRFKFMGGSGAYHFLYVVGEPVPGHEEWMAAHPGSGGRH